MKMMRTLKENKNKGFTLVELIVVVAIIAIIGTAVGLSYSRVSRAGVKTAAQEIKSVISECRVDQMSRSGVFVADIFIDSNDKSIHGRILKDGVQDIAAVSSNEKRFARFGVTLDIKIPTDAGFTTTTLSPGDHLYVSFMRSSGRLNTFYISHSALGSEQLKTETIGKIGEGSSLISNVTKDVTIQVYQGDYKYDVDVHSLTGSQEMKRVS